MRDSRAIDRQRYAAAKQAGKCVYRCGRVADAGVACRACVEERRALTQSYRDAVLDRLGRKCACCGEQYVHFLQVDHVQNDGCKDVHKRSGRKITGHKLYKRMLKEGCPSDRYQILCANCNIRKHLNHGQCDCPYGVEYVY